MKIIKALTKPTAVLLSLSILLASCSSTTLVQSTPSGAKVYINGEAVGTTPYTYSDTKIVGSTNHVRLTMEGYEDLYTYFSRNEEADAGAIVGGIFVLVPFLWTMKYKPTHTYELTSTNPVAQSQSAINPKSKTERIKDLKQLLDDKAITQEEFEREKQKVLSE